MRQRTLALLALGIGVFMAGTPLLAHHSFSAEYDPAKPVKYKGIVTKVDWMNPHVLFYIDVADDSGKVFNWACEMGPPTALLRGGWTKNAMKIGDEVIVDGTLAKDGAKQLNARTVTLAATGKRLGAGSSQGVIP